MILLVDGNNIAYRSFFTKQGDLATKKGEPSGVILGFLNSLKGYLEKFPETTKVIVCWDGGKAKWRMDLYPTYKGNRDYGDDDSEKKEKFQGLWDQIDILHGFLHNLGVHSIKVKGQEADDVISQVPAYVSAHGIKTHIMVVTSDKDMFQLVNDNVSIYTPHKDIVISPLNFEEEMGVTIESYMGYRALVGDKSDNIIGVPGIGEVTAKNLMKKYGHIDNILNPTPENKAKLMKSQRTKRIFEKENLTRIGLNHRIMNFNYVPYNTEVEDNIYKSLGIHNPADGLSGDPLDTTPPSTDKMEIDNKKVKAFLIRWEFVSVLSNYLPWIHPFMKLESE